LIRFVVVARCNKAGTHGIWFLRANTAADDSFMQKNGNKAASGEGDRGKSFHPVAALNDTPALDAQTAG